MKKIKQTLEMIAYNFKTLVWFELIFKILSFLIFSPFFMGVFRFIMNVTGYSYLTLENVVDFLLNPVTLLLLLLLILMMMVYTMFDITTIIIILDSSYHKKKISIIDAIWFSIQKCVQMFHYKNILLAVMTLFLIPFLNIGVGSSFISTIQVPEFISLYISENPILGNSCFFVVIGLIILLLRWIYALHYYVLEGGGFLEARRKSICLGRKKHLKDLFTLVFIQVVLMILYLLFILLGLFLILCLDAVFSDILVVKSIVSTIIWLFIAISFIVFVLLATPISYAGISSLFYLHKINKKEEILPCQTFKVSDYSSIYNVFKKVFASVVVLALLAGSVFTYGLYKGNYNLNIEHIRTVEVTAHRGNSIDYPENTMASFKGAKDAGANWIELDVQETLDREIVVIHDANLQRVTGVHKNVGDATYKEIQLLDAGSFFKPEFKDERIPLLKDVVKWAKENNMKLNIELKPTGREVDFEKHVVDIVTSFSYMDSCVISSQVYQVLENVKAYNRDIQTVYVMSLAFGNILSLDKVDAFSIEASNVNEKLVQTLHKNGKELYVWTVNTDENIRKMIDYNVDNIITDNVSLAKDIIYESKTSNLVQEYVKFIENIFA